MSNHEQEHIRHSKAIEVATPHDLDALKQLLLKANAYSLRIAGTPTWKNVPLCLEQLEKQVVLGNTHVIRDTNNNITSSISLSDTNESWNDTRGNQNALYFTKLMKDPDIAGQKEAKLLLQFAGNSAINQEKSLLRCDTKRDQDRLIAYYEKLGFEKKGYILYKSNQLPGVLLEIPVTKILDKITRSE